MTSSAKPSLNSPWDSRHNNFDALRILLALLVLASHCMPLATGTEEREWVARWTHHQLTGGAISVDLFFVMSGFMITASMERSKSAWQFAQRRIARIYPGFLVCALLGFFVFAQIGHAELLPRLSARIGDFLLETLRLREFTYSHAFAHNIYDGRAINGSVWSIQYECWCYVGVMLLGVVGLLKQRVWPLLFFVGSLALSVMFLVRGWVFGGKFLGVLLGSPQLWARLLPYYLAGVVFYLYRRQIPHSAALALLAVIACVVAARVPFGVAALFPMAGSYLVFYLAYAKWLPLTQAGRFGDFSYGLYLYAFPIQQTIVMLHGGAMSPAILFVEATPLVLLLSVASWYGVERRFLRPGRRHETIAQGMKEAVS
ncbi:acyltransferase family protein [Granulicella cerasi]|uniref:Acyltransferase family protein n=1 Tax=Granulicella cerasi TaxID=741063 RepID=A0ABW1ZD51_9BACT|nr:acyltransferase [Granulicella cerasi]